MEALSELLRPEVRTLKAYHVDEPDVPVKLHANESPFNIPESLRAEISHEILSLDFNRYPEAGSIELRDRFASQLSVEPEQVVIGNGSDELIQMILMAFGGHDAPVVFPHPTFSMYRNIALSLGERVSPVPLDDSFELEVGHMAEAASRPKSITFISYPNNPTGNCFAEDGIEEIIRSSRGLVVVDEAYFDYSRKTFLDRLKDYPNLIILRTLSKTGFASLRLGILIASTEIADLINRVRLPYNITTISQLSALAALKCTEGTHEWIDKIISERERLFSGLEAIEGLQPFRSDSNFILFRTDDCDMIFKGLVEEGVLIRNLNSEGPLKDCLRVTVGLSQENDAFLSALKRCCRLNALKY